jgi:zinc/manganese transport system substrate-binding protein
MKRALTLLVAAMALSATACSSGSSSTPAAEASPAAAAGTPVAVVASTDVYGDIVKTIGGDAVAVTSVIDNPDKDPHEYEADAQTQLAVSKAQLVVENGGGYDDFIDTMLAANSNQPTVVNVVEVSGYDQEPADGEFNEHMWYDFSTMEKLATRLSSDLAAARPDQAQTFKANASAFTEKLKQLKQGEADIKAKHSGDGVAVTEPVPGYLLDAAGLVNKTPDEFSEAIEEDSDVAPAVLKETLALFEKKQVKLLAYNEQTTGPQTESVLKAAQQNGVAVVPVTETLPAGETYLTWMQKNVAAVAAGVGG